jgi:hypothetical protein
LKTFKAFISEAKQVGDVYHFTKQHNLESILDSGKLHSHSGHISATRNHNLPMDMNQKNGDFSFDKGYNVRLTLDGNKISEHHKVKYSIHLNSDLMHYTIQILI